MPSSAANEHSMSETTDPVDLALSTPQSLSRAVYARRAEYTRPRRIRLKVGSWNVAACPGTDKDLATWFVDGKGIDTNLTATGFSRNPAVQVDDPKDTTPRQQSPASARVLGGDKIDLYILGLQEVVNLNPVTQYVYSDTNPTDKWRLALEAALPDGYQFVGSEQMSGLLLLMYASPGLAPCIANVSTKAVGTGVGGWFGNKGATAARIVLGEATTMVFVNSHLSSGNDPATVDRRCWDARTILDRTRFDPVVIAGNDEEDDDGKIGSEDFAFWFGDLNFRLDGIPGDDIRHLLTLHSKGEYDVGRAKSQDLDGEEGIVVMRTSESSDEQTDDASGRTRSTEQSSDDESMSLPDPDDFDPDPHEDPASLQATLDSLLPHDQLLRVRKEGKIFHDGWHEGPITFLPSYKYDVGTVGLYDSSEKKRAPSWCDRILYRTKKDTQQHERKLKEEEEARKRDEEMRSRGIDQAGDDDEVLFDYDPESDGDTAPVGKPGLDYDEYDDNGEDATADAVEVQAVDRINLDLYTSHQRITSSDHKPLVAVFELDFDAVVPELKADIYAQVARELDRAENEGRPSITIVREGQESGHDLVDFGQVSFMQRQAAYFTIANTGGVPATISFIERPRAGDTQDGGSGLSHWLTTSLDRIVPGDDINEGVPEDLGKDVILEPGETVNATLEMCIDQVSQARALNEGREKLEEVVVLRVAEGRDHFLPIRASWAPTCVGRSIDELIRVPDGGIRAFVTSSPHKKAGESLGAIPSAFDVHRSAPKELFKLVEAVEALTDRTLAEEEMLDSYKVPRDQPGWPFEGFVSQPGAGLLPGVIEALDTDQPIADAFPPEADPCQRLEAVAGALLLFLQGLTDGIINTSLWSRIEQAPIRALGQAPPAARGSSSDDTEDDKSVILDILMTAPNHNICFVFLTTTLAKVIGELAPLKRSEVDALSAASPSQQGGGGGIGAIGALGRRSLSIRRSLTGGASSGATTPVVEAIASLEKRKARERRVAQIFGTVVCRTATPARDKERRMLEDKQKMVVELFLRRREGR
ncbi:type ii inositol-trisphosphate 5-phosphatase [Diaporthe amygdali]|uniref:type ii inositol-trisphosphate 5-phosphatase n=1 Tax=Phomopsis amygdali TaxID=1214568 RepID=UPI0022FE7BBF|nr:type ii inositol-trisphosphate 5-phosphatase [Diaporthe amygdali]KAJ0116096.1 type ii inositol-trisphosphate 5-phosphatase [Diaporthe amygdali]